MSDVAKSAKELTAREQGILKEFASGASPAEIARNRSISQEELEIALLSILEKLEQAVVECIVDSEPSEQLQKV